MNKTARIWEGRVPATLDGQIAWEAAAQTDFLSDVDRTRLGLPADTRITTRSTQGSACDQAAGADAGEPTALARFGERDEQNALAVQDQLKAHALLLRAFRFYAAVAERAHDEDWPDEAWRHWRYRRATLARLLAREGLMTEVADAYTSAREQMIPH